MAKTFNNINIYIYISIYSIIFKKYIAHCKIVTCNGYSNKLHPLLNKNQNKVPDYKIKKERNRFIKTNKQAVMTDGNKALHRDLNLQFRRKQWKQLHWRPNGDSAIRTKAIILISSETKNGVILT